MLLRTPMEHLRECPCYLHRYAELPYRSAQPCICECDHTGDPGELMPTPRAGDGEKGGPNQRGSSGDLMLPSVVTLLGTPTARDHKGSGRGERHGHPQPGADLLPTPDASAGKYRLRGDSQQSRSLEALARRGDLA